MSEVASPVSQQSCPFADSGLECTIRAADHCDAPALAKLRYALRASTGPVSEPRSEFLERCTRWMAEHLKDPRHWRCWVAEQDGKLIGSIWLQLVEKIPNPRSESEYFAYITNFFVEEFARGKGIGSHLLARALTWCRTSAVHSVILWPTQQSRSLYERNGFAVRSELLELVIAKD